MKVRSLALLLACLLIGGPEETAQAGEKIRVVTTISTYASIAALIGGERVSVTSLIRGDEDPHFVRPKLSFSEKLAGADLFVDTGLDLEMWVPALQNTAGNKKVLSGGIGYVSASSGIDLLEVIPIRDRSEGDIHAFGNPHVYTSPLGMIQIARNIALGLQRVDPAYEETYRKRLREFEARMREKLYGPEIVGILGGRTLDKLAWEGKLISFLEAEQYSGKPLIDYLGGWMKEALPLRGKKLVAYHRRWAYLEKLFGFEVVEYIEPKPGLPPTPRHVKRVMELMKKEGIKVILVTNYDDLEKVTSIAKKVGGKPVIVGVATGAEEGLDTPFDVVQRMVKKLVGALAPK